jgi:hypothetical protein
MTDAKLFAENAFFLIGAPKCGTTSLAKHLSEHPEISFSDPKEPHFFSPDYPFGPSGLESLEDYLDFFPEKVDARRFGEGSVFYLYSERAIERIEALTETRARYIVCLRDPVKASFSLHAQHVAFGWDPERDYLTALRRNETDRGRANPDPKLANVLNYARFYQYAPYLARLLDQVDEARVFFSVMERDSQNLQALYDRLHRFLRVSDREVDHRVRVNDARRIESDLLYRALTSRGALSLARVARRLVAPNGFGLKRPIRQITDAETRAALDVFRDDIEKTAQLAGFDPLLWTASAT